MYVLLYSSDRNVDEPIVYLPRPMPASMHITSEHFWHTWTIRYTIIHIHGSYHHNTTYECHEILLKALPGPMLFALNCASLRSGHSKLLKVSGQHRINLEGLDSEILAYQKIRQCLKGLQFVTEYPQFSTLSIHWVKPSHTENRVSRLWPFQGNLVPHEPRTSPAGWPSEQNTYACPDAWRVHPQNMNITSGVRGYFFKENCKNLRILLQLAQQHIAISYLVTLVYATSKKNQATQAAICFHWPVELNFMSEDLSSFKGNAWRRPRTSQSHAYYYRRHKRNNSQRKKYIAQLSAATQR